MKKSAFALSLIASTLIAAPAMAQMPKLQPDDSYVSISGTVLTAEDDEFSLDYGQGHISVEMDDMGWVGNQPELVPGDEVTVYGRVEEHLFVDASIEADSIFIEDPATYYYSSPTNDMTTFAVMDVAPVTPVVVGDLILTGTVQSVKDRQFTVNTGDLEFTVDTSGMQNNPLDNEGRQKVGKGDTVSVAGNLGSGAIGDRKLNAESIIVLRDQGQQGQQKQQNQQMQQKQGSQQQKQSS